MRKTIKGLEKAYDQMVEHKNQSLVDAYKSMSDLNKKLAELSESNEYLLGKVKQASTVIMNLKNAVKHLAETIL